MTATPFYLQQIVYPHRFGGTPCCSSEMSRTVVCGIPVRNNFRELFCHDNYHISAF